MRIANDPNRRISDGDHRDRATGHVPGDHRASDDPASHYRPIRRPRLPGRSRPAGEERRRRPGGRNTPVGPRVPAVLHRYRSRHEHRPERLLRTPKEAWCRVRVPMTRVSCAASFRNVQQCLSSDSTPVRGVLHSVACICCISRQLMLEGNFFENWLCTAP
jgi:hypothetical protein